MRAVGAQCRKHGRNRGTHQELLCGERPQQGIILGLPARSRDTIMFIIFSPHRQRHRGLKSIVWGRQLIFGSFPCRSSCMMDLRWRGGVKAGRGGHFYPDKGRDLVWGCMEPPALISVGALASVFSLIKELSTVDDTKQAHSRRHSGATKRESDAVKVGYMLLESCSLDRASMTARASCA